MLFKIDENLHLDIAEALRGKGHDVSMVFDQGLAGKEDPVIGEICKDENRALVSLDLDFANIKDYPPEDFPGIIILRVGEQNRENVNKIFSQVLDALEKEALQGCLWIVEEKRIRIRRASPPNP